MLRIKTNTKPLLEAVRAILPITRNVDNIPVLFNVQVRSLKAGIVLTATDRYRMVMQHVHCEVEGHGEFLVNPDSLRRVLSIDVYGAPASRRVTLEHHGDDMHRLSVITTNSETKMNLFENPEMFPRIERLARDNIATTVEKEMDARMIGSTIRPAGELAGQYVTIGLNDGGKTLTAQSTNHFGMQVATRHDAPTNKLDPWMAEYLEKYAKKEQA